jgi:hypothetical protein
MAIYNAQSQAVLEGLLWKIRVVELEPLILE